MNLSTGGDIEPGSFRLSLLLKQGDGVAATLLAYPDPKVGGGYFLLLAGAPQTADSHEQPIKRELTLVLDRRVRLVKVLALGERRGPSATARELYEELTAEADPLKPLARSSLQIPSLRENKVSPGRRVPAPI